MDLSAVIVNFNTKDLCAQTVKAFFETSGELKCEVIVCDNSSVKEEVFSSDDERVKVFKGLPNRGFGAASNFGARRAEGDFILFLNSDTILKDNAIVKAVDFMRKKPDVGCLGIRTLLEDGSFDHGCKRGFPTPFRAFCYFSHLDRLFPKSKKIGGYRMTYISEEETAQVECVSGAFMLMPREVFLKTGGFDENIFMHGEDIDLCRRIELLGLKIVYKGDIHMIHLKGRSGLYTKKADSIKSFYNGITYVYDKYYNRKHGRAGTLFFHAAIGLKCTVTLLRHRLSGGR
ncbi:MAG: glycosyltransferase [Eubacterium sp.]|nr:glycosyltransferase [Eubacterium sp.]